jgi:hypothetical protein
MNKAILATFFASAVAFGQGRFGEMRVMGMQGMHPGQVVAGAPFSGQEVTTETQTLANGTHITNTMTATFYRDASGRTRVERTLSKVGPWSTSGQPKTMVEIFDPVAGMRYMLNPAKQTGEKETLPAANSNGRAARIAHNGNSSQATITNLGSQTIQGLNVTGTLTTRVIPAGQMGNDQAITITDEKWYSPDLQMTVLTKHIDPRSGETDFAMQNISRTAPDASLFSPPSSYTLTTRVAGEGRGMMPPPPPPGAEQ